MSLHQASGGNRALLAGALALSLQFACTPAPTSSGPQPADAGADAAANVDGGTDAGDDGGTPPPCDEWGSWESDFKANWSPAPWATWSQDPDACVVEVSTEPRCAVPPLVWIPCEGGEPGCTQATVAFPASHVTPFMVSVVERSDGYYVGARLHWKEPEGVVPRAAVYGPDGLPLVAWRTTALSCLLAVPWATQSRVWLGASRFEPASQAIHVAPSYAELSSASTPLALADQSQLWRASDDIAALHWLNGAGLTIHHLPTGTSTQHYSSAMQYGHFVPHGDVAVGVSYPALYQGQVGVWSKDDGMQVLFAPAFPRAVVDAMTDGTKLVWMVEDVPPGTNAELWTAPLVKTAQGFAPTLVRSDLPVVTVQHTVARNGLYAMFSAKDAVNTGDGLAHIYRLADGHHWSFVIPQEYPNIREFYHINETEVWYQGYGTFHRQRLDALGSGDPPP